MTTSHTWSFARIGGFEQVLLKSADDLRNLDQLDPKLWAALACPTNGLHFDQKTLHLIDNDNDGRIRVPEILDAVRWTCQVIEHPELLLQPTDTLPLSELNTETEEGNALLAAARRLLKLLGKPDAETITLADVTEQQQVLANARFNGDGVITPATAKDDETKALIATVIAGSTTVTDASGAQGVNAAAVSDFFTAVKARLDWISRAEPGWVPDGVDDGKVASDSLSAVRDKIDDYFSRCRASQYDPRATEKLNRSLEDWSALNDSTLSADCIEIADFPLAMVRPEAELPLNEGLNPAWESRIKTLHKAVIKPVLGELEILTYDAWQDLKERFDKYQTWLREEAGKQVSNLDAENLNTLLTNGSRETLATLIAKDEAVRPQVKALTQVETLLRYRLHLKVLLENFVNLSEFYAPEHRAVFEAGTLFLDGRACDLCIEVYDPGKHASLAGLSRCFLAYCDCTRKDGRQKTIVAAFTGGSQDYLLVGRNGVFYDREGVDWDATITKLVENPISIPQAFFSPYKRLIRFMEEQAAKSAEAAESSRQASMEERTLDTVTNTDATRAGPKPKFDLSMLAAMGIAVGGLATAVGMLLQAFFGLGWLMPIGFLGLILVVSGPSMFIAWLKLRQRNLGPILDASGWAVNGRVKINVPFGSQLTKVAHLPKGSNRSLRDPYQHRRTWPKVVFVLVIIGLIIASVLLWRNENMPQEENIDADAGIVLDASEPPDGT